jgi:tRNA pseudouridine38-40 synthase
MTNWKLTLAYNGSGFHGWQVQPGLTTVQGTLAEALRQITGETVLPQGAGRTDTGVHALAQVASFTLASPIPPGNLQRALNRILPAGIRVLSAEIAPPHFHARHSSRGKRYEYRIFERRQQTSTAAKPQERICSPFLAPFVWDCRWPLDLEAMQAAAQHILGTHDFTAMAASASLGRDLSPGRDTILLTAAGRRHPERSEGPLYSADSYEGSQEQGTSTTPNPLKTIQKAAWRRENDLLFFQIQGSGFLHHMVRNLVGTMVDIGRGSLTPDDLPRILASRDRSQAGPTAPASGLFLVQVLYPTHPETASPASTYEQLPEEVAP